MQLRIRYADLFGLPSTIKMSDAGDVRLLLFIWLAIRYPCSAKTGPERIYISTWLSICTWLAVSSELPDSECIHRDVAHESQLPRSSRVLESSQARTDIYPKAPPYAVD